MKKTIFGEIPKKLNIIGLIVILFNVLAIYIAVRLLFFY